MVTLKKFAQPVKCAASRVICRFRSKSFAHQRYLTQHLNTNLMCQSRNMALQRNQIGALRQPLPSSTSTTSSSRIVPPQISNFPSLHHEISQNASSSSSSLIAAVNHNSTSHDISASDMEEENDNQSQSETIAPPSFANINLPQSSNLQIYSSISSATNNANLPKKSAGLYPINRSIFFDEVPTKAPSKDDSDSDSDFDSESKSSSNSSVEHARNGNYRDIDDEEYMSELDSELPIDITRQKAMMDVVNLGTEVDNDIKEQINNNNNSSSLPEELIYISKQIRLIRRSYGEDCLKCQSFEELVAILSKRPRNEKDTLRILRQNLFQWITKNKVSRSGSNELLSIITSLEPKYAMPSDVRTLASCDINNISQYDVAEIEIDWIKSWQMKNMIKNNFPKIKLFIKDPIEMISYMFIEPKLMFGYKKEVKFRFHKLSQLDSTGKAVSAVGDVMTSFWCEQSEKEILTKDVDGYILPLIFYSDGVCVSESHVNNKVTPVICTTGNFPDVLIQKDIAKRVISYLPSYNTHSKTVLIQHLHSTLGISISAAERNVRYFELYVERTFWHTLIEIISNYSVRGVKLQVLGQGIKTFYPRIAFVVGDDPAQHRISGLSEGMATHGCTYCNYNTRTGLVYDPQVDTIRDIDTIRRDCSIAKPLMQRVMQGQKLNKQENIIIKKLQAQNVHPYLNPFFNAPMGFENNIYQGATPDLLHLFCAGLMKSLVQWVMTIISCISQYPNSGFKNGPVIFDSRISNFPYVHDMPHLYWTTFRSGLMQFGKKSKKEKELATGSLGGFKSTTFISLLVQIYFSIGFNNDVLPTNINFMYYQINLGNVANKVLIAIASLLDAYFQSKRTTWTNEQLDHFGKTINELYVHLLLVWDLKQTLLGAYQISKKKKPYIAPPRMRKLHMILHLVMYIIKYGSLIHMDTSTYESLHKYVTTVFG